MDPDISRCMTWWLYFSNNIVGFFSLILSESARAQRDFSQCHIFMSEQPERQIELNRSE